MRKNSECRRSMTVLAGAGGGFVNKEQGGRQMY